MTATDHLKTVLDAGKELGALTVADHAKIASPFAALPDGRKIQSLESLLPNPVRKRGMPRFSHERGFTGYVNDHKDSGSRVFADLQACTMTAVLDLHDAGQDADIVTARWGQHRAFFSPPHDPDWITWTENDNTAMSQFDFAQFLEDNLPAIVSPDGAELLEVAQHLEAKTNVSFKSAQRLQDGNRKFHFEEQVQGKVGKGAIEVPEEFRLRMPVFVKGDPVELTAKLRYRIDNEAGGLKLWYHLHRPHDALDEAFQKLVDGVEVATTLSVWFGTAAGTKEAGE